MRKILLLICLFLATSVNADPATLIINALNKSELSKAYRSTTLYDPNLISPQVSQEGLSSLDISGSAQYSAAQFSYLKDVLPYLSVVFDLRQESHGFINGNAVSWFVPKNWVNLGLSPAQVQEIEKLLLDQLIEAPTVKVFNLGGEKDTPKYTVCQNILK